MSALSGYGSLLQVIVVASWKLPKDIDRCFASEEEQRLEVFVARQNIERYRNLLAQKEWTDPERQMLLRLIREEEAKNSRAEEEKKSPTGLDEA